ncbi:MAG TPA: glycosyltransferase [Kiritimatiellia bacterium]|nr:glycosyltransferase [Kiritimatiellia bacterium]
MTPPAVSILLPAYNREALIQRAIDSVTRQTFTDFELIIIDDASTDTTLQIARQAAANDPRIRVIQNLRPPHGPGPARNAGLPHARAPWIAFLDSDDTWHPEKLHHFLAATTPSTILIGSNYHLTDTHNQTRQTMWDFLESVMFPWWTRDPLTRQFIPVDDFRRDPTLIADPANLRAMTLGGYLWPHTSSVMVQREALLAVRGFNPRLQRTEDLDLWLNLLPLGPFTYLHQPLGDYYTCGRHHVHGPRYQHHHPRRLHTRYTEMRHHLNFIKSLPRRFPLSPPARDFWRGRILVHHRYCWHAARPHHPLRAYWHYWQSDRLPDPIP